MRVYFVFFFKQKTVYGMRISGWSSDVCSSDLYGGTVAPSFPSWLIDGTRPSRLAWLLKERILPPLYWKGMLKGHERSEERVWGKSVSTCRSRWSPYH